MLGLIGGQSWTGKLRFPQSNPGAAFSASQPRTSIVSGTNAVPSSTYFRLPGRVSAQVAPCLEAAAGVCGGPRHNLGRGSPTFGEHLSVELSDENRRQFWVPRGFAQFVVLSETVGVSGLWFPPLL
jgi:dTDP-4-dehydrorhamnose 3,5-epimerase